LDVPPKGTLRAFVIPLDELMHDYTGVALVEPEADELLELV
jgi:hypothetical protein